ncbi:MAG: host attachment protein [Parvularculaceae bacterium]
MPLPKRTTWFLIADSAKARVIKSSGPGGSWERISEWADEDARTPSHELGLDRPPRGRNIGTGQPFAIEGGSLHDKAGEAFLAARAKDLELASHKGEFDQLVVAAAPAALGLLRKKLPADVTAKLVGVFDKDMTNETDRDLHGYFADKLEKW